MVDEGELSRFEEGEDDPALAIEHLVRSGLVVDATRLAGTVVDAREPGLVDVLDRLRSDGYAEHVRAVELVQRQPAVLEFLDRSDRWTGLLTVAWFVLVGVLAGASTWPSSAPILVAVLVGATLVVVADAAGPRWLVGIAAGLGYGLVVAVAGIGRVADGADAGLDLIHASGEQHHLIDRSRIGLASAAFLDEVGNARAQAVPRPHAAARRRIRFFGTGALACVSIGVALLLLGAIFGEGRRSVDPVDVSPGRTIWVGSDGRPFVECPSLAAAMAGADLELCEGQVRGHLVAAVVLAAVLVFAVWVVGRTRLGRMTPRRGVGVSERA